MHPYIQDLFFSLRSLRRSPGFTAVVVLTLGLGIAANTVIFSVVNATMLRPLPYPDADRLILVGWQNLPDLSLSAFFMVQKQSHSLSQTAAVYDSVLGVNISAPHQPLYVRSLQVSKEFFPTLGVLPELGRAFNAEDDQPNAPHVVILSDGIWTQNFSRDRSALGQKLQINGEGYKIIGIMPREFRSYPEADIWVPLQPGHSSTELGNDYRIIGRLAEGSSRQQALIELDRVAQEYHRIYPWSTALGTIVAQPLQSFLAHGERQRLTVVFAAIAFVFLIACTNVAILVLVRGAASAHTIAVRASLGPPRARLVFSLLSESVMLAFMAGVVGLILAKESLPLVTFLWPTTLPLASNLSIDWRVALFTVAVSIFSCTFFGLGSAWKLSQVNIAQLLARTSRTASMGVGQVRMVRLLVCCQMALTVMLLAGTLLLLKSLLNLYSVNLGFDPAHLAVGQVSLAGERYRTTVSTDRLLRQVVRQLETLPGVDSVGVVDGLPLEQGLTAPIHPPEWHGPLDPWDQYRPVTTGYFKALRIPLRSGRLFQQEDNAGAPPVAILNEAMARHWWANTSPIGQFIQISKEAGPEISDVPRQIIGVVGDIHEREPGAAARPTIFVPISQTPDSITRYLNQRLLTSIVVRGANGIDLSTQFQKAIHSVDSDLPLASYRPFTHVMNRSLANQRFLALLTSALGIFAFLLTIVGLQGLFSYQARLRTREIAVRVAVGASRTDIVRMVVQQGTKLIFFALLAGIAGSIVIQRLLGSLLYNASRTSLIVIFATGLLLGVVAGLMSLLTASRAAAIEPMAVLRNE